MASCDDQQLREQLLAQTPMGSTMEQVAAFCLRRKLECRRSDNAGYMNQATGAVVGEKAMWAAVEETHRGLMVSSVEAYWGFGSDGVLVDVWIWRTTDAP